jgi:hypothetical protein
MRTLGSPRESDGRRRRNRRDDLNNPCSNRSGRLFEAQLAGGAGRRDQLNGTIADIGDSYLASTSPSHWGSRIIRRTRWRDQPRRPPGHRPTGRAGSSSTAPGCSRTRHAYRLARLPPGPTALAVGSSYLALERDINHAAGLEWCRRSEPTAAAAASGNLHGAARPARSQWSPPGDLGHPGR